jgi:hypothetical protein
VRQRTCHAVATRDGRGLRRAGIPPFTHATTSFTRESCFPCVTRGSQHLCTPCCPQPPAPIQSVIQDRLVSANSRQNLQPIVAALPTHAIDSFYNGHFSSWTCAPP